MDIYICYLEVHIASCDFFFTICKQRNWYFHMVYSRVGALSVVSQITREWLKPVPKVFTKTYLCPLPTICIFF